MDTIVAKLSEIESAAEAIVAHAETQKSEIEQNIQRKRNDFDHQQEADTLKKLDAIRSSADAKMEESLSIQREKNQSVIRALKQEFKEHHATYAKEILQHMTEV